MLLVIVASNERLSHYACDKLKSLFSVLSTSGYRSYSCLSPAEETVVEVNLWFIWAQTTFILEQKGRIRLGLNHDTECLN